MSELKALEWYFHSPTNMALYNLNFTTLRRFDFKDAELDRIENLCNLIDKDAGKIINAIEPVYRDKKCKKYISTRSIPKRKHGDRWEFQYKVLHRSTKKPDKYKSAAYIGTSIELNSKLKPALILWVHCRDIDSSKKIYDKINNTSVEARKIWGPTGSKNIYVLGEVNLIMRGGRFKTINKISEEFADLVDRKLLKGGERYSLIARFADFGRGFK